jgi:two-component system, NtrC family, sensor kinase
MIYYYGGNIRVFGYERPSIACSTDGKASMQQSATAETRYCFPVLYIGDCADRYELMANALARSRRLRFVVNRQTAGDADVDRLESRQDDVWLVDACDDPTRAEAILNETDRRANCPARVLLVRPGDIQCFAADATLDIEHLDTDAIERSIAEALRRRHDYLAYIEQHAGTQLQPRQADGELTIDQHGRIESANAVLAQLLGYASSALHGLPATDVLPAIDTCAVGNVAPPRPHETAGFGAHFGHDVWAKRCDGRAIPVHVVLSERFSADGQRRLAATVRDLREAKESERQLRQSQRFLQATLNSLSARIAILDDRGVIIAVNDAWRAFADKEAAARQSAIVGANYLEACNRGLADCGSEGVQVANGVRQLLRGQRDEFQVQYPSRCETATRWFAMRATRFPAGGPLCAVVAHEDMTERRHAEESLAELSRQNQLILNSVSEGIVGFDQAGNTIFINSAAAALAGWPVGELLQAGAHEFLHRAAGHEGPGHCPVCATLSDGTVRHRDDQAFHRRDDTTFPVEYTCMPVFQDGARVGAVLTFRDVTERKRLQTQLLQAQKLESIGQLAAGIAHEINTPTQYIGDNTHFLQDAFGGLADLLREVGRLAHAEKPEDVAIACSRLPELARHADIDYLLDEIPKAISQSIEGIERVAGIVRAMKDFAHPGTPEKTHVDLNRAIQSTLTVARNEWKYVADVVTDLQPDLPPVPCLPGEINQVVLNLVVNAAHAIGDVVAAGRREKGKICVTSRLVGAFVEIRVMDDGTGIPKDIHGKVFDPFFSTKGVGKGTGQGLAISHAVVTEKHGGTLTFDTEIGRGTTFIIRLPVEITPDDDWIVEEASSPFAPIETFAETA